MTIGDSADMTTPATSADIRKEAAAACLAKIAEIDSAEQTLLMGGKFVVIGGTQYSQEDLADLRNQRSALNSRLRILIRKQANYGR